MGIEKSYINDDGLMVATVRCGCCHDKHEVIFDYYEWREFIDDEEIFICNICYYEHEEK